METQHVPNSPGEPAATVADQDAHAYASVIRDAGSLPPDQRAEVLSFLFSRWADEHPVAAAAAALALDQPTRDSAWPAVVQQWARSDPASLAAYALELPADLPRRTAIDAAVTCWMDRDPLAARAWVEKLPSAPENDTAVALIAINPAFVAREPELALDWAESVRDPVMRLRALGSVIQHWRQTSPNAAESYARGSPFLTAEDRERILGGDRFSVHP